jgi:hypothetical protein
MLRLQKSDIMKKIRSKIKNEIIHIIFRKSDFPDGINGNHRVDIAEEHQFLQLSALSMEKGRTFKPHKHIWKKGEQNCIAQESWVVISGKVRCFFYDVDDNLICEEILHPGDCSMTFEGGHTYLIESEDTLVYEFKTGPYKGQKYDKVFIGE